MFISSEVRELPNSSSCSRTLEQFVPSPDLFGGVEETTQVSKLSSCKLNRIASLSFDFYDGACTNFNHEAIYLCFNYVNSKDCRKSRSPLENFDLVPNSNYDHKSIRIASNEGKKY